MQYNRIEGTLVIGIGHAARQGKDSLADFIIDRYPRARKFSFADDLKAFARVIGVKGKNAPILQALGTSVFRAMDEDFWLKCMHERLQVERPSIAIIPDCRFPNEFEFVKQMGGQMVKVIRLNKDGSQFITKDRDPNHPSEVALKDHNFDMNVFAQDGDLEPLKIAATLVA